MIRVYRVDSAIEREAVKKFLTAWGFECKENECRKRINEIETYTIVILEG